jgi:hypothetical protein
LFSEAENKYKEDQKRLDNEVKAKAAAHQQENAEKKEENKPEDKMDIE